VVAIVADEIPYVFSKPERLGVRSLDGLVHHCNTNATTDTRE